MPAYLVPLAHPQPNAEEFIHSLLGRAVPSRVPFVEYIVDDVLMRPLLEQMGRAWVEPPAQGSHGTADARPSRDPAYWDNYLEFWYRMGYPYVRLELSLGFALHTHSTPDTAPAATGDRAWVDYHHGALTGWEDFERFPWPRVEDFDFWPFEYLATHLPEGLGLIANHAGGPYEWLSHMLSYENLALKLHDDPAFVEACAQRIGELMEGFYRHIVELPNLLAVFPGDDMGFRTGTLIAPDDLRRLTLPWHRRFARLAHQRGVPYFLHSCGNLTAIMEDLIEDIGLDAKHSFEDAIMPVEQMYDLYSSRLGLLGGVDLNLLAGGTEEQVRARVRQILDHCAPGGRYALGSGNSIPSYVPLNNYLAMLDEGLRYSL